jgi:hypothetical protein
MMQKPIVVYPVKKQAVSLANNQYAQLALDQTEI